MRLYICRRSLAVLCLRSSCRKLLTAGCDADGTRSTSLEPAGTTARVSLLTSESQLRGLQTPWAVRPGAGSVGLSSDAWPTAVSLRHAAGASDELPVTSWVLSSEAPSNVATVVLGLRLACAGQVRVHGDAVGHGLGCSCKGLPTVSDANDDADTMHACDWPGHAAGPAELPHIRMLPHDRKDQASRSRRLPTLRAFPPPM